MSHISRLPLPSISLILTTDHTRVPRRPSVVKNAPLPLPSIEIKTAPFDPMVRFIFHAVLRARIVLLPDNVYLTQKTIHSRDFEPQPLEGVHFSQEKYNQSQHVCI